MVAFKKLIVPLRQNGADNVCVGLLIKLNA